MRIDAAEAAAALGATVAGTAPLPGSFRVATDTRTLQPGDAFVAVRGERYDGHDYLEAAVARGAACVIVSGAERVPAGVAGLVVRDTTAAYLELGAVARRHISARVIAVTGSTGKTTTKAFIAQLLERAAPGRVAATFENENNEIGVAKLLLAVPSDAAFVVAEFGARRYGEIVPLARAAQPHVAVLTNVGDAHLEIMGSAQRLAETKWGIFTTGAHAVLSAADATSLREAPQLTAPRTWAALEGEAEGDRPMLGARDALVRLYGRERLDIVTAEGRTTHALELTVAGEHNRRNAVAAAAAALAAGVPGALVARALADVALPPGRYERVPLGQFDALYDAYNASLSGTLATLASFAREAAGRRIAVLGSMAELGPGAPAMHARVGAAAAASGLGALLVGGDFAADLARGASEAGFPQSDMVTFADNDDAVAWLRAHARPGDLVLIKGSRRYRLEEVLKGLRSAHAG